MAEPVESVKVRVDWDHTAIPLRLREHHFHTVHVAPEPGWPFGRKGLALAGAWHQLAGPLTAGLLILDGDVAVDLVDVGVMFLAIEADPDAVLVAPVRLWPTSTGLDSWVWGHGRGSFSQADPDDPDLFSFGFTYLPRKVVEGTGLGELTYPMVDQAVAAAARDMGVPVRVVRDCTPKHLNF
jgi:hypothetical protein